jgi:hypothetical protein
MAKARTIVLQSTLSPDQCRERLRANTDVQQRTLFSFSGYKGKNPVLCRIEGEKFQLQKRRYYRNDFAPNFYGTLQPWGNSARIEGYFGPPRWTIIFLRIWLGATLLFTLPVAFISLQRLFGGSPQSGDLVGLLFPFLFVGFGLLAPRFGDWLGRNEKAFLLQFMETTLAAKPEEMPPGADFSGTLTGGNARL